MKMKTALGLTVICLSLLLGACATGLNIQKKCKEIAEIDAQGASHTTDNYVCE